MACLGLLLLNSLSGSKTALAQTYLGLRAGPNIARSAFQDSEYKRFNQSYFSPGFTAGILILNEANDLVGIQSDISYSMKRRLVRSSGNIFESNRSQFHFIDIPLLFKINFPVQKHDVYLLGGPQISFWLGGKGNLDVYDVNRDVINRFPYQFSFVSDFNAGSELKVPEANRVQLGLTFGAGWRFTINDIDYFGLELRYEIGHTQAGARGETDITPQGITDNFKSTFHVLSVNGIYYFNLRERIKIVRRKLAR
jgi:hypothetical protein